MPTLLDFRRRIRSVKNTQQITRAMKFVAAARLRRAQDRAMAARPYAQAITEVLESATARIENRPHPLLAHRPEQRTLLLVMTGDRGLCGAFNANVIRRATEFLRERRRENLEIIPVGKKGRDALRKQKWTFAAEYINVSARAEFSKAREIAGRIIGLYMGEKVDAVYVLFNEFKSVLTQTLTLGRLLPIEVELPAGAKREGQSAKEAAPKEVAVDYIYEQPAEEIFNLLLPRYVESLVYRALADSAAAEHAARMTAMESATKNAGELIEQLTLQMNKIRQAAITREIIEVVSGANLE